MDDIRGHMNPLSRLPMETLSHIFSMTVPTVKERPLYIYEHGKNANRIMLVCREWRDIALQCPTLWTSIWIDLNEELPIIEATWERSVERVKRSPANICLLMSIRGQDIPGHSRVRKPKSIEDTQIMIDSALRVCDLRRIPVISELEIRTSTILGTKTSLSLISHFPVGWLNQITIYCNDNNSAPEVLKA